MAEEVKGLDDRWVLVDTHVVRYGSSLAVPVTRELKKAGYAPGDPIVIAMPKAGYRVRSVSMYVMDEETDA